MTEQVKFQVDGAEVVVDPKLLQGYYDEAEKFLAEEAEQKANFKDTVETVSETTKLPKRLVSKYFKAKYKESTKVDKEVGEVFGILDDVLAGGKGSA